jgi:hypothetical protein
LGFEISIGFGQQVIDIQPFDVAFDFRIGCLSSMPGEQSLEQRWQTVFGNGAESGQELIELWIFAALQEF